jgi:hypothetical protein
MEGNEFQKRSQEERSIVQDKKITATLEYVKGNNEKLDKVFKELRAVRQDLRNLENLRPLRNEPDSEEK